MRTRYTSYDGAGNLITVYAPVYAYFNASDEVVATSFADHEITEAKLVALGVTQKIVGAPGELRSKDSGDLYHKITSGDGTDISHYATEEHLANAKKLKCVAIDKRTSELIDTGFVHNGKTFSASFFGQLKWTELHHRKDSATYPYDVMTIDDTEVVTMNNAADVTEKYDAVADVVRGHINSGTNLKKAVQDATDLAGVAAVTDTR